MCLRQPLSGDGVTLRKHSRPASRSSHAQHHRQGHCASRGLHTVLACSLRAPVDKGTVSFVLLAAGIVGYLRLRQGLGMPGMRLLARPAQALREAHKAACAAGEALWDSTRRLLGLGAADDAPDARESTQIELSATIAVDAVDGGGVDQSAAAGESAATQDPAVAPPTVSTAEAHEEDVDDDEDDDDDLTDAAVEQRASTPLQGFFDRLSSLQTWTLVGAPSPTPSPRPASHRTARRRDDDDTSELTAEEVDIDAE